MRHRTWRGIPRSLHPLRGAGGRVLRVEQSDAAHPQRAGLLLGAMRPVEAVTTEASSSRCRYSREMRPETRGRLLFLCLPRPGPLALPRQDDSAVWEVRGSRLRAGEKDDAALHMPANLETSAVSTALKISAFI